MRAKSRQIGRNIKPIIFDSISEVEFREGFLNIITLGSKDNTYKFALARFLLDYSNKHVEQLDPISADRKSMFENDQSYNVDPKITHVDFTTIAKYFLKYYWTQICKLKMKHAPQATKRPEIVKIIEKEFGTSYYPQTFDEIKDKEPKKIENCIKKIVKLCFHNVTWRFQRIKVNKATESRLFFDYKIARVKNPNKKYVDLEYGINLNPQAMIFLKQYNAVLLKAVILEWARFLEKLNIGMPKIIAKTDGKNIQRGSLLEFRKVLKPHFKQCFYCKKWLEDDGTETHVEHVIPFDYIAEDDIWNLALACKNCNLLKLGALPPREYLDKLIRRNKYYRKKIPMLDKSLIRLESGFEKINKNHYKNIIEGHYVNAKSHGYMPLENFPKIQKTHKIN